MLVVFLALLLAAYTCLVSIACLPGVPRVILRETLLVGSYDREIIGIGPNFKHIVLRGFQIHYRQIQVASNKALCHAYNASWYKCPAS